MANIKILEPGDEARLESFLLPRLDSSMFLLGNMRNAGLAHSDHRYAGTYAASVEGEQITGVVTHFNQGNLICQAPPEQIDMLWRAAAQKSGRAVHGVVGPAEQVEVIRHGLGIDDSYVQMDETEQLFNLMLAEMVIPEALSSGHVRGRRIQERDLELLTEWRIAYSVEALGSENGPKLREQCRANVERSLNQGTGWVLETGEGNEQRVAFSDFNAVLAEAVQVAGVWTPPEFRGRGYARAVVAASLEAARDDGVEKAILFTDNANVPAQKAYRAIGFERIGDYRLLLLHSPVGL